MEAVELYSDRIGCSADRIVCGFGSAASLHPIAEAMGEFQTGQCCIMHTSTGQIQLQAFKWLLFCSWSKLLGFGGSGRRISALQAESHAAYFCRRREQQWLSGWAACTIGFASLWCCHW